MGGYIIPLDESAKVEFMKKFKNAFKKKEDIYTTDKAEGICVWGHLEAKQQEILEEIIREYEQHLKQAPTRAFGTYFGFLGDEWVEEAVGKQSQLSLF